MCGILGSVASTREEAERVERHFDDMLAALRHRGPDGLGVRELAGGRVRLGHARLAIIDLSDAGRQPMSNEDDSVWLTFNGEIYNYRALRDRLVSLGHRFRSQTDSEVIVHAYEQWGDDCVLELRGIFAFAIWDERRQRLFAARDRLGVKPLYHWSHPGGFVFASEPRAILAHPAFERRLSMPAFQAFLAHRYVPGEMAIFEGMSKLSPAHRMVVEGERVTVERYWDIEPTGKITDPGEAAELIATKITEAVRRQLVSDVPVGVLLSGGIDSSTVTAIAAEHSPVPTFTIGFEEAETDERIYARRTRELFRCPGAERVVTMEDAVGRIPAFIDACDEPFFDHSIIPTLAVHELVREHGIKVVLAGDGGDELFAGYRWYDRFFADEAWQWGARLRNRLLRGSGPSPLEIYFKHMGYLSAGEQATLLPAAAPGFDHLDLYRRFYRDDMPVITALQLLDLNTFLVDDILVKLDRASMAYGIEARVPLLDEELVAAAFSIDSRVIYGGERKALLKRAVADRLPPEILTARKKGFSIPLPNWLAGGLGPVVTGFVLSGSLVNRGIFRADAARAILAGGSANRAWMLFVAEAWARRWLDQQSRAEVETELLRLLARRRGDGVGTA